MLIEKIKGLKLKERNSNKKKKGIRKYAIRTFLAIAFLFIANFCIDKVFNVDIMNVVTNKILNSLGIYTEEVRNVEIESSDYASKAGGSWHIDKTAMWTGRNTAKVTFNLNTVLKTESNYKDIILVFDKSNLMFGDKLTKAKSNAIELVNYILTDNNNRVALITFDSTSEILSGFTNDKDLLIEKIKAITYSGLTNYNEALRNIDVIMNNYKEEKNRDVVALFLVNSYPSIDTPNQVGTYEILKDKYPYISIKGIQYEMGTDIIKDIEDITDYQYIANQNTLNDVLFEAAISPEKYEKFQIVDYIDNDYFYVNSVDDIKVSKGEVTLEEENGVQKIIWNFNNSSLLTGGRATMEINLTIKDEYIDTNVKGYFPTNQKEVITYKLLEKDEKTVNSSKTPVLKNIYNVIYDTNPPAECSSIKKIIEEEHFVYDNVTKRSDPLTCDGWQFKGWEIAEDVTKVNDDVFVMPEKDVNIRGTWTRQYISKSMDGTVREKLTLYKEVKKAYDNNNGAALYTGNGSETFKNNVYYYNGDIDTTKNNLIFANFCWKIVRTTETGGVKIVYNGVPSADGKCNNTGEATYIGNSEFNVDNKSSSQVGYMYNPTSASNYSYKKKGNQFNVLNEISSSLTDYYYGNKVEYDGSKYTLKNSDGSAPTKKIWRDNYSDLIGYYRCRDGTSTTCNEVYYIAGGTSSYQYILSLAGGKTSKDIKMTLGNSITKNADGTYTLNNPVTINRSDWYTNYGLYKNYYTCSDQVSITCDDVYTIGACGNYYYNYWSSKNNNYLYGKSFIYEGGKYKLIDAKQVWDLNKDYNELNNRHYTCFNEDCTTLSYVYFYFNLNDVSLYYINLTNGKSVEDALDEMFWNDNVNSKDSTIKEKVDTWYKENMMDYTEMLEDTVFCNDRSIYQLNGWNPNGGSVTDYLYFGAVGRNETSKYDLTCVNKNDRFTTSASNGNGKLTYPVGLLTSDEAGLSGSSQMKRGSYYWLSHPYMFYHYYALNFDIHSEGNLGGNNVGSAYGVRPSVSLKPGTEYSSGDGSINNPFIVLN